MHPHPENPNNGDVDVVIESIMRHGFTTVCIADRHTRVLTAGHTRYAALHALGADKIPMVFSDGNDADNVAYMIVDNESSRMARMDEHQEARLLRYLASEDKGLFGSGFDEDKLAKLLLKLNAEDDTPLGDHFRRPTDDMPLEIFQIVITFESAEHRDQVAADLGQVYENVRVVDL